MEILLQDWLRSQLKTDTAIAQLSRDTGIARTTIYRILNGKGDPEPGTIKRIANALGVPVPKVEKVFVVRGEGEESVLALITSAQEQLKRAVKKVEQLEKASTSGADKPRVASKVNRRNASP